MKNLSSKKRKSTKFIVTKSKTILFSLRYPKCSWKIPENLLPSNLWFLQIKQTVSHAFCSQSLLLNKNFQRFLNFTAIKSSFVRALLCAQYILSQKVCLPPLKKLTRVAPGMTQVPSVAYLIITFIVLVK